MSWGASSPVARVRTTGGAAYFRARERLLAERKAADRLPLLIDLVQPLLQVTALVRQCIKLLAVTHCRIGIS